MIGVAVAILGLLIDALWSVTRQTPRQLPRTHLTVVESADRRNSELPFVGADRRAAEAAVSATAAMRKSA